PPHEAPSNPHPPTAVGRDVCASCHEREASSWTDSDHDLAMQEASDVSILGNFDGSSFSYNGVTTTFFKKDGGFRVRTDGPDGQLADYKVAYTFGVTPLQQYLIEYSGGRFQSLGIAWDSRPDSSGGQRWFHLYPDEAVGFGDELHWTSPNQNWNYQCADCHSTGLQKGFDLESNTYNTTWDEINVSCEACHGLGSNHVSWAERGDDAVASTDPYLSSAVGLPDGRFWVTNPPDSIARLSTPGPSRQIEVCARCHARRGVIDDSYMADTPFLDTHRPALLDARLYYPDGQIDDEVYVYGSFLQSKMYAAGVVCSDCHDPHSLRVKAPGNALCAQCHSQASYDGPRHSFHEEGTEGGECVNCHMPTRNYMVVDPRLDHGFKIPRPDLSIELGVPNACNGCHSDKSSRWATETIKSWYPKSVVASDRIGQVLARGRIGAPGSPAELSRLADGSAPGIVRASALALLARPDMLSSEGVLPTIGRAVRDPDGLVRMGALQALGSASAEDRRRLAFPLLADSALVVRIEAVRALAPVATSTLSADEFKEFSQRLPEFEKAQLVNADRPESHINLGVLYTQLGRFADAEQAYLSAIRVNGRTIEARVNLADLYRVQNREDEGATLLREALSIRPEDPGASHALGLLLVRAQRLDEALPLLEAAARNAPESSRYSYVYSIALNSVGRPVDAVDVAEGALLSQPYDRSLLELLVSLHRDMGRPDLAYPYIRRLQELGEDPNAVTRNR
ncbi:MAG: tetratricopeptide repeat protein, partial [Rhodothermia bacterium]